MHFNGAFIDQFGGNLSQVGNYFVFIFQPIDEIELDLPQLEADFNQWWAIILDWISQAPKTSGYVNKDLWNFTWSLYRVNHFPSTNSYPNHWILGCRGAFGSVIEFVIP